MANDRQPILASLPKDLIVDALKLLRFLQAIRDGGKSRIVQMDGYFGVMKPEEAGRKLDALINGAINKKAGWGPRGRKDSPEYAAQAYRDQQAIRRRITQRVRVYQFETPEARRRFGHLLSRRDD